MIGVFRTALGRDPGPAELAAFVPLVRGPLPLTALAERLVETSEFRGRHGSGSIGETVATLMRNAFGSDHDASGVQAFAAALGASKAELVAVVASVALARGAIPLLPGLAPGAAPDDLVAYKLWVQEYDSPDPSALACLPTLDGPCISIAMSAGDTQAEALERTVQSLGAQIHPDWELCLAARTISPWSRDLVARLVERESRIKPVPSGGLKAALAAASGPLVCVLEAGDQLAPSALYEVGAAFAAHPETELLYTDEDVIEGGVRRSPRLKPGFSPDALFGGDLIGQLAVYRAALLDRIGGLPEGQQPLREMARRAAHAAGFAGTRHLPAVLCHRGQDPPPMVRGPSRAALPDGGNRAPSVTVIVLTRDRADLLRACVDGVLDRTAYPDLELLVVDNGSTEAEAVSLLAALAQRPNVRVLSRPGPFNFAAFNNAAAAEARGEILLLLNNDIEVLEPDWLGEMVGHASRPDVGAVGARLLYPDGTVQHGGILLGPDGSATHVGRGARPDEPGYLGQFASVRDLSAVTGACLAIRSSVWAMVGGMDERLAVTWNDVDLCLRVRRAGLRVLWTPFATLLHREGSTRGLDAVDPAREQRFRAEQATVRDTWGEAARRDPFLNANLIATETGLLALSRPRLTRPWHQAQLHTPGKDGIATGCVPVRSAG